MAVSFSPIVGPVTEPGAADWPQWSSSRSICRKPIISYGDLLIIFESALSMQFVTVTRGQIYSSRKGHFHHDDMIGKPFGAMLRARKGVSQARRPKRGDPVHAGWVVLLSPTPELWTLSLNHRTQILYDADIAMVVLRLDLKPGSVVVESGTGSCSLTTALARAVAPSGHVFTFEFNGERHEAAQYDLRLMQLQHLVTCTHRNVLTSGFAHEQMADAVADAVFLDLPSPWEAIGHAHDVLRAFGRLCSFSPCIEQVQRTCDVLRQRGFVEIVTVEVLRRTFDAHVVQLPKFEADPVVVNTTGSKRTRLESPSRGRVVSKAFAAQRGHTGYLTFARKSPTPTSEPIPAE